MLTQAQCRAARAMLRWSGVDLAKRSGVSRSTIADFELGRRRPTKANLAALRRALEATAVQFIDDEDAPGVRFAMRLVGTPRPPTPEAANRNKQRYGVRLSGADVGCLAATIRSIRDGIARRRRPLGGLRTGEGDALTEYDGQLMAILRALKADLPAELAAVLPLDAPPDPT